MVPELATAKSTQTDILSAFDTLHDSAPTAVQSVSGCKAYNEQLIQLLEQGFKAKIDIYQLVGLRSTLIDSLLKALWQQVFGDNELANNISLLAVGGYGRGELHPHSDIDLLILYEEQIDGAEDPIEQLITMLWDMGIEIGHSVRSLPDCIAQAADDVTIATNIMEARLLIGNQSLFDQLMVATNSEHIWSGEDFFRAKYQEQQQRHIKFRKTSYALEPNIKKSPGTLRDIQMVGWIAKRHYRVDNFEQLTELGFLNQSERVTLEECEKFLWRVRFALHMVANKSEDRLLFDYQTPIAEIFGFEAGEHLSAVEQFMQKYYRVVKTIRELNDMLLQHFSETILDNDSSSEITILDDDFQICGDQGEILHEAVFRQRPENLLTIFLHLAENPELKGIRAPTLRRFMLDRKLIDEEFRRSPTNKVQFIELFKHPNGMGRPFALMKRYGVLKAYLPAYAKILGQMQFDLFHIYTVDEHTLFLIDNLAQFNEPEAEQDFPLCAKVSKRIEHPYLLYLAGLFHDIGKGRGGDHSEIGAEIAKEFCQSHQLDDYHSELVQWLVLNHLLMSMTAQRMDISDPEVIQDFIKKIGTRECLDYLYLLTVADIRATNPSLWNNWKDTLLRNLYHNSVAAFKRGIENPQQTDEAIDAIKHKAKKRLAKKRITSKAIDSLWQRLSDDYFLRNSVNRIAWQTSEILRHKHTPLISVYRHPTTGATEVFIYMPKHINAFTLITSILYEKILTVHDASLHLTNDNFQLATFVVLETDGSPISSGKRVQSIKKLLSKHLRRPDRPFGHLKRRQPHRYKHFDIETEISFRQDEQRGRTLIDLVALDKPGLLARVGQVLKKAKYELYSAKIVTLGEKVEDLFSITDSQGNMITDLAELETLKKALDAAIESTDLTID